jgi:large subunit ribosomal protein L28
MGRIPTQIPLFSIKHQPLHLTKCRTHWPSSPLAARSFSTTAPSQRKNDVYNLTKDTPPYPYGPRYLYKQSNFGLYGMARVRFGNRVADSEFKTKTRRRWHPNVQNKHVFSEALDRKVKVKMTTRVMRTIDKVGGLDNYLLGDKPQRLRELGPKGWTLRWKVMQTPDIQARFAKQREELGLKEEDRDPTLAETARKFQKIVRKRPSKEEKLATLRAKHERRDILRISNPRGKTRGMKFTYGLARRVDLIQKTIWTIWDQREAIMRDISLRHALKDYGTSKVVDLEAGGAVLQEIVKLVNTVDGKDKIEELFRGMDEDDLFAQDVKREEALV